MKGMLSKAVENNIKYILQLHLAMHEVESEEKGFYSEVQEQTWKQEETLTQMSFKLHKEKLVIKKN